MNILIVIGTRPELIKLAPVVYELRKSKINYQIINTAQHKDLLEPYWDIFGIMPDYSLNSMNHGQSLSALTANLLIQMQNLIDKINLKIDLLIAQGDTTTVMVTSMIGFYNNIPFAHVEAGLRTSDLFNPFPEEYNRRITSISSSLNFAPTSISKENLSKENLQIENTYVTGNTVVDALKIITKSDLFTQFKFKNENLLSLVKNKTVLITCHRRENHGENLNNIIQAILELAKLYNEYIFVWPLHPNPNVKNTLLKSDINEQSNILLVEPLDYISLLKILELSKFVITDSGGIQEESPSFGVPVVILRESTERPEGVNAGIAKLAGADKDKIIKTVKWADAYVFENKNNPYGEGNAAEEIVKIILKHYS